MKVFVRILIAVMACGVALWAFGPREPVALTASFNSGVFGEGIDVYLESTEGGIKGIRKGEHKRIIWAGQRETRTPLSVVYLHGFSASSEEIRPVPDRVAQALGANLVFTRFTGHSQDGPALARATMADWMADTAEALALGRATGDRVIVISTSTGGTFAALAALDPEMSENIAGITFVSPNFAINNPLAPLLTWPAARYWLPLLAGDERSFEPLNDAQARHWTTRYPSAAVFPLAAAVRAAAHADYSAATLPALFYYDPSDVVVKSSATDTVRANWGGPVTLKRPPTGQGMDPSFHVVAGDIVAPAGTDAAVSAILNWAKGL